MKTANSVLAVATILLAWRVAIATSVGSNVTNDPANDQATISFTVTAGNGETIKDIHFEPPVPKNQNLKQPLSSPSPVMPTGWQNGSGTSDHVYAKTSGSGLVGGTSNNSGTFSFTFSTGGNFAKFEKSLKRIKFTSTNDGADTITKGTGGNVVDEGGPVTGGQGGTGPYVTWPLAFVDFKDPSGNVVATIDSVVAFRVETSFFGGQAFRVYSSTALSQTESGTDNPLGVDIDTSQPIPTGWGLEITPTPGRSTLFTEVEDDLDAGVVTVAIPDDLDLVGNVFYLAAASDSDGDGRPDLVSRPLRVTIQNQGSATSGIEVLEYSAF